MFSVVRHFSFNILRLTKSLQLTGCRSMATCNVIFCASCWALPVGSGEFDSVGLIPPGACLMKENVLIKRSKQLKWYKSRVPLLSCAPGCCSHFHINHFKITLTRLSCSRYLLFSTFLCWIPTYMRCYITPTWYRNKIMYKWCIGRMTPSNKDTL